MRLFFAFRNWGKVLTIPVARIAKILRRLNQSIFLKCS